ncbi:prepilin-type N-terminal cleavage/methylation domain-containing protein [Lysobacter humi (ex Lee et al. 2017)]
MRPARGFTLVEVLLATALLAAGLALAFATLGGATTAARRGEALAQANEHIRGVQGFLRRRLAGARAVPFQVDTSTGLPMRFSGEAARMRFVSDLPDYIGRGGPSLHELRVEKMPAGEGLRLTLGLAVVQAGATAAEPERAPELLAENLKEVSFRYRGLGEDGQLAEWRDDWTAIEQLPLLVEIRIVDDLGRPWPDLIVAPRLAAGYAGGVAR